jgi:hypothetical protein
MCKLLIALTTVPCCKCVRIQWKRCQWMIRIMHLDEGKQYIDRQFPCVFLLCFVGQRNRAWQLKESQKQQKTKRQKNAKNKPTTKKNKIKTKTNKNKTKQTRKTNQKKNPNKTKQKHTRKLAVDVLFTLI